MVCWDCTGLLSLCCFLFLFALVGWFVLEKVGKVLCREGV